MDDLVKAAWHYRSGQVARPTQAPVKPAHQKLADELLDVSGRYLSCILPRTGETLRFYFQVHGEALGIVKLDLQPDWYQDYGIIGGFDLKLTGDDRFFMAAENYYIARDADYAVPAVCFGVFGDYGFYIASLYGFERVDPFFIHASHRFLARLLEAAFRGRRSERSAYLRRLAGGEDEPGLMGREPLMRSVLQSLPGESRGAFFRQLSAELERIITA